MLALLRLSVGMLEPSSSANVFAWLPAFAVMIAVCCGPVAVAVNVNVALLWPEATLTDAGTFTAVLLLERLTDIPLLSAAVLSTTVQMSVRNLVMDSVAQPSALIIRTPCLTAQSCGEGYRRSCCSARAVQQSFLPS